MTTHRRR